MARNLNSTAMHIDCFLSHV